MSKSKPFGNFLDGVKLCENMYQKGKTFEQLENYIKTEGRIIGWSGLYFNRGFEDAIEHFKRLEQIRGETNES